MSNAKCIRLGGQILDVGAGKSIYDALIALANNGGGGTTTYVDVADSPDLDFDITGSGTQADPWIITATLINTPEGAFIDVVDTDDVSMNLTGSGLASDPYELSAALGNRTSILRDSQSAIVAPNTSTDIIFQSPDLDGNFSYSTATGLITFSKSGKYTIQGIIGFQSSQTWDASTVGQSVYARATVTHNTTVMPIGFVPVPSGANYGVELLIELSGAVTVAANDTLKFSVQHNATGKALHPSACFVSIEKVG